MSWATPPVSVVYEVENTWTRIFNADEFLLNVLDFESRYATEIAHAKEAGFLPPEERDGWDGWVRLLRRPKTMAPYFPTGLLSRLERIAKKMKYELTIVDKRVRPMEGFPEFPKLDLREHQEIAVDLGVRAGRGIVVMPPRGGKTRAMAELQRRISLPTLWTAPTDRIVQQTVAVLEGFFGKHYVHHLIGGNIDAQRAAAHAKVVCCTGATATLLSDEFLLTRQMLVVDEWHHGAAKTYRDLFKRCDHIYFRFGMTGTNFRSGGDDLAMHALLSNVIHEVSSEELLRRGYLVPTKVVFLPMPSHPKVRSSSSTFITGHGKAGIHEHAERNRLVAHSVVTLHRLGRQVLVLVGTKKQGREIQRLIEAFLPKDPRAEFKAVEFVSTDTPRPVQNRILESYLAAQEVKVLIGTSLLGEGVDLPSVNALVYARGEQAEVTHTQAAYRVCTAVPGKMDAVIVDFADRHHKKLVEHSLERLNTYYYEPTFKLTILGDPAHLGSWAEQNLHSTAKKTSESTDLKR